VIEPHDRPVPYDLQWPAAFEAEAMRLKVTGAFVRLHHMGSTAIPGMLAKPIIDILAEAETLDAVDSAAPRLADLGYEARGEYGIAGRRYFRRHDAAGFRTHHLHVYEVGSAQIERHLMLRDYLLAHPVKAEAYAAFKRALIAGEVGAGLSYAAGKVDFVECLNDEARAWRALRPSPTP
jgi:GrpB-like predicted nucleotidyltransferase (UPF0157 family)